MSEERNHSANIRAAPGQVGLCLPHRHRRRARITAAPPRRPPTPPSASASARNAPVYHLPQRPPASATDQLGIPPPPVEEVEGCERPAQSLRHFCRSCQPQLSAATCRRRRQPPRLPAVPAADAYHHPQPCSFGRNTITNRATSKAAVGCVMVAILRATTRARIAGCKRCRMQFRPSVIAYPAELWPPPLPPARWRY